eukprot:Hpha_TRINITY_DN15792_c4_g7::TRINITY_DN15792_c4_g7_i1::g.41907::m.41907
MAKTQAQVQRMKREEKEKRKAEGRSRCKIRTANRAAEQWEPAIQTPTRVRFCLPNQKRCVPRPFSTPGSSPGNTSDDFSVDAPRGGSGFVLDPADVLVVELQE